MAKNFTINGITAALIDDIQLAMLNDTTPAQSRWLVDTFFSREVVTSDERLAIASLNMSSPIAPYVNPCVEGRPIRISGSGRVDFVPFAYVKPKLTVEPCKVVESALLGKLRASGMTLSTRLSDAEALVIDQMQKNEVLRTSVDNRVALMAAEIFVAGKVIVASDDQPKFEVDFGRDPAAAFVPAVPWNQPAAKAVDDLKAMGEIAFTLTGGYGARYVMRTMVWEALRKNPQFIEEFITPYGGIRNVLEGTTFNNSQDQANRKIVLDNGLEIWTYDGFYTDDAGVRHFYLPDGFCGLVTTGLPGVRAYGKIHDIDAGFQGFKYYPKTWTQPDPSLLFIMVQSAPMVVPPNPNMVIGGAGFVQP